MPNFNFHYMEHHTRVEVESSLLTGGRLNTCLLQLPQTVPAALVDEGRPVAVNVLRDLVIGGPNHPQPALEQIMPGAGPVLIVAPEYALGSGDWMAVDAIVRGANRPLVLVTGFGASLGQAVLDWQAAGEEGGTNRHFSWQQESNPISPIMRVNGGWCWIHEPGGTTHCLVYLKNVLEQAFEAVVLDNLQTSATLLQLRFTDLDLFPLICADLLQPAAQYPCSPQARVQQALAAVPPDRPALVVGSLLQTGFSPNWAIAIDSLLNTVLADRSGAVALCNVAHDAPEADEDVDKWRSLSGVFAPFGKLAKGQASLSAARALNAQGVVGAVVRQTNPSATAGLMSWPPYNPVSGNFVWRGNMCCPISNSGLSAPITAAPDKVACEISRFLRRHPPGAETAPRLVDGVAMIHTQLQGENPPSPSSMLGATLDGVAVGKVRNPDALAEAEVTVALKAGLHALATLRSIDCVTWQSSATLTGQLQIDEQHRHLLIWRSPSESPRSMKRQLAAWRLFGGEHPNLVVIASSPLGDLVDGEIEDDRRDDFSLAPSSDVTLSAGGSLATIVGDFTAPRARRRVAGLGLSHVAAVYADYEPAEDGARVEALLGRIGAFFQGGA